MRRILGGSLLVLWLGVACGAESPAALAARKADAKKQQSELRERIDHLQKDIDEQEASRRDVVSELRASETAISASSRRLEELAQQKRAAGEELRQLTLDIAEQKKLLARHQADLAEQLRGQYASGMSPWAALLSGDNPQEIGRNLSYFGYVSQAQAKAVRALRATVARLAGLQAQARARTAELARVEKETTQEHEALEAQKAEREKVLSRIEGSLHTHRVQADTLERNEKRLGKLIVGLDAEIARLAEEARKAEERRKAEEKRRAEEARRAALERQRELERQRKAALEAEKTAREAQARAQRDQDEARAREARMQVEQARAQAREAEQAQRAERSAPPSTEAPPEQAPERPRSAERDTVSLPPEGGFKGLSKGLAHPVAGDIQGRFGAQRPDGGVWRGVVIRAAEGARVKSVAAGRVVYANWLKGFGNLIIVDHGAQYLSVYAYNQSLLRKVGEVVKSGEAIAMVGATGGQVEPGLYFEIRHQGVPVNPLLWLTQ